MLGGLDARTLCGIQVLFIVDYREGTGFTFVDHER